MVIEQNFLELLHTINNDLLDIVAVCLHFINDKGFICILLSLLLVGIPSTRKVGIYLLVSIFITAVSTEILKELIIRERPFNLIDLTNAVKDTGYNVNIFGFDILVQEDPLKSYPSGHVSSISALTMGVYLTMKRKTYWIFIIPVLMMWSRMYLFMHYPSDVFAGMVLGFVVAYGVYEFAISKRLLRK